ncbi:hypothetical protein BVY04_03040 [bacterium M21]|nr:hypothetical protein BVY04_03040 [bacterium M21]
MILREQAQNSLRTRETYYRMLFEGSVDGIAYVDRDGSFLDCNPSYQEIVGYSKGELLGMTMYDITDSVSAEWQRSEQIPKILGTGEVDNYETIYTRKDGTPIWVEVRPHKNEVDGKTILWEVVRDISARKRADRKLRESEARLKKAEEIAPLGYWEYHFCDDSLIWSDETLRIFGAHESDVEIGLDFFVSRLHPDDKDAMLNAYREFLEGDKEYSLEHRIILPDGEIRYIWGRCRSVERDSDGAPRLAIGTVLDITERKLLEKQLTEYRDHLEDLVEQRTGELRSKEQHLARSEAQFRAVFEQAAVGVAIIDSQTGSFIRINQRYCDIIGYSRKESLQLKFQELTYPADLQEDLDNMDKLKEGVVNEFTMEKRYLHKNGSLGWVKLTVSPMWPPGSTPTTHIAVVEDITKQKATRASLELKTRDLDERVKELGCLYGLSELVAIHGHDLPKILEGLVALLPPSWQYPDIAQARVCHGDRVYSSSASYDCRDGLMADIIVNGTAQGSVQICYMERVKSDHEGPFLREERQLLDAVAERLGRIIEHIESERELEKHQLHLEELVTKRSEALVRSERKYRDLYQTAGVGFATTELVNGKMIRCNAKFASIFGYETPEICIAEFVGAEHYIELEEQNRVTEALMEHGELNDWQVQCTKRDGTKIWIDYSARLDRAETCIHVAAVDITDHKQAEKMLRDSEETYRAIFNGPNEAIFIHDAETGKILDVNETMLETFQCTKSEALQATVADLSAPDEGFTLERALQMIHTAAEGIPQTSLWYSRRLNGELFWSEVSLKAAELQGRKRVMVVVRDITERKEAEEKERQHQLQLLQADKMASLGLLVSGVAHEINNPNNLITLNVGMLEQFWPGLSELLSSSDDGSIMAQGAPWSVAELRGEIPVLLAGIKKGGERITGIVNGLRDFARTEKDCIALVQIAEVIESTQLIIRNFAQKRTRSFTCDVPKILPAVRGNAQKLEQVMINLITNACQAVDREQGVVAVRVQATETNIEIRCEDNGCGISSEELAHIFDPFFTTKREVGGTGLGLAISYSIVEEHSGTLRFESEVGQGTVVILTLPIAQGDLRDT